MDNVRLWNVAEAGEPDMYGKMKSGVQFKIIPGHHGGFISQMCTLLTGGFHRVYGMLTYNSSG